MIYLHDKAILLGNYIRDVRKCDKLLRYIGQDVENKYIITECVKTGEFVVKTREEFFASSSTINGTFPHYAKLNHVMIIGDNDFATVTPRTVQKAINDSKTVIDILVKSDSMISDIVSQWCKNNKQLNCNFKKNKKYTNYREHVGQYIDKLIIISKDKKWDGCKRWIKMMDKYRVEVYWHELDKCD